MQKKRKLRQRIRWTFQRELGRKFVHLGSLFYLVLYFIGAHYWNKQIGLLLLTGLLIILCLIEYWRLEWKSKIPIISLLWHFKRPSEQSRIGGEIFFALGALIALSVFDLQIALAAILMTTFGDFAAALVGKLIGRIRITRKKKLEGIIAEFGVNILTGFLVLRSGFSVFPFMMGGTPYWGVIVFMAATATIVETFMNKVDDNLVVPVFAGFAGQIAMWVF